MKKITQERLIELAEGFDKPTAEESHLLESDAELSAEYMELKTLFADLRAQPEPALDEQALKNILPGVRAGIAARSERNLFASFATWRPAGNILAVAASLVILLGLLLAAPGSISLPTDQDLLSYGFASAQLANPALDVGVLQLEAEGSHDFELFGDIEETLDPSDPIELLDEDTFDLMERATSLDDKTFDHIKKSFAATL